jgi:hypothetical protein
MIRLARVLVPAVLLCACLPARVDAQWYFAAYVGANHNSPGDIAFTESSSHTAIVFHDVRLEAQPFMFPLYAGGRFGYHFQRRWFGVEAEWLHMKVIAETHQSTHVTGTLLGNSIDSTFPMSQIIQRYEMSHGLNYLMGNFVVRMAVAKHDAAHPASVMLRAGAGPVVSGTDSQAGSILVHQYEHAGFGGQLAAGMDVPLSRAWSFMAEYKFTYSKPQISVGNGQGQTTAMASQIMFGLTLWFGP